jgi:hypothetical protein
MGRIQSSMYLRPLSHDCSAQFETILLQKSNEGLFWQIYLSLDLDSLVSLCWQSDLLI